MHELPMPNVGDELHHFGWNRCSSACHGPDRSHLIVPGFRSSRIHVVNVADDPRAPRIEKVIEPDELVAKTGYTRPHTVHCMPGDNIVVSMLGDADGNGAGGFAVLDAKTFEVKGRWENGGETPSFNYDFWYQPRKNALVSSEFGEPNAYEKGFDLADVEAGRYGQRIHFWNLESASASRPSTSARRASFRSSCGGFTNQTRRRASSARHSPACCGTSTGRTAAWAADPIVEVESVPLEGWPFPVPGVMSDLVLSMDDRFLYLANWLHGDVRQYDVSDPANPKLTGQLWLGGVIGKPSDAGRELHGGPNMVQLSFDGRRLYVTNSLYSTWDNQFYPELRSWLLRVNCGPDGGMEIDRDFFVDFQTARTAPRAPTRCACRTATAPRRSSNDARPRHGDPRRGDRAPTRAGRRCHCDRRLDRRPGAAPPATSSGLGRPASWTRVSSWRTHSSPARHLWEWIGDDGATVFSY